MQRDDLIGGRYAVEDKAGSGGLGVVFRCLDRETGARVAVKLAPRSSAKLRERFLREAEMLGAIRHPNVVRYLAHGIAEGDEPYLVMEWLDGEDLERRLARAPLTLDETIGLALRLASALAAAHARGIVHRDVKPANVLLVGRDPAHAKLIDFGVARAAARDLTLPGGVLGTPGYMAPEQARGDRDVDARADVFSLGCVLFECLTGRRAFEGDSPIAVLARVLLEDPPPVRSKNPDVPAGLDRAVARMLSKAKEARQASADEVLRDLELLDAEARERAGPTAAPATLTTHERKLLSVLLARRRGAPERDATIAADASEPLMTAPTAVASDEGLRTLAGSLGTNAEVLLDGSIVVVLEGTATDQATRAARAALRLAEAPGIAVSVATGRGEIAFAVPFGEVVDRAGALLDGPPPASGVRLDALTASLLEGRYRTTEDAHGAILVGELSDAGVRTLLGRASPCVGREREIGALLALYDEAADERAPRVAMLAGEAGIGKSRVRFELGERLRARGDDPLVLSAAGDVAQPGAPFGLVSSALRRELGLRPSEREPEHHRARIVERLSRTMEAAAAERLAPLLAQLAGLPLARAEGEPWDAARADPTVMGDRLRAAWQDFLEAEGRARPVVLVVEDLQWADRPSVTLFEGAARALHETPLFVLVTARPEVSAVFPTLFAQRGMMRLDLAPLPTKASEKLLRAWLPATRDAELSRLSQQAAGNPFLLEELARAVALGRGDHLPDTVLASVQARLEALPPAARRLMRAASVLGDDLSDAGLATLLPDLDAKARGEQIAALLEDDVLVRADAGDGLRFRQSLLREASYAALTDRDRRLAHALAAGWLERRGGAEPMTLAAHFERGGRAGEASAHYVAAAEQSLEGSDLDGAMERAQRAQACGAAGELLGRALLVTAEIHRWRGEPHLVREDAGRAASLFDEGSLPWLAARVAEASASAVTGDVAPLSALGISLCLALEGGDASGPIVYAGARVDMMLARYAVGTATTDRLLAALEGALDRCRDDRARGMALAVMSNAASDRQEMEGAMRLSAQAVSSFDRAGDVRTATQTRINQGYHWMQVGQYERAEAELRAGLAAADRAGLMPLVALAQHNLGPCLLHRGDAAGAEAIEREAILAFALQRDKRLEGASRYYLGLILLAAGRAAEAEAEMRRARADVDGAPSMRAFARAGLSRAILAQPGRADEAIVAAEEGLASMRARNGAVDTPHAVLLAAVEARLHVGRADAARALLAELTGAIRDHASRLQDPELVRSYLDGVEENARALALEASLA